MSVKHNPEFTTVELYEAYADYHDMMDLVEELYAYLAREVCGSAVIPYQEAQIDMGSPWQRLSMVEAVKKYAGVDYADWKTDADAQAAADAKGVHYEKNAATKGDIDVYKRQARIWISSRRPRRRWRIRLPISVLRSACCLSRKLPSTIRSRR